MVYRIADYRHFTRISGTNKLIPRQAHQDGQEKLQTPIITIYFSFDHVVKWTNQMDE